MMSGLFFLIAGVILGWLLRWLWEAVEIDDAKLFPADPDRDYVYDSRTGERSGHYQTPKPEAPKPEEL